MLGTATLFVEKISKVVSLPTLHLNRLSLSFQAEANILIMLRTACSLVKQRLLNKEKIFQHRVYKNLIAEYKCNYFKSKQQGLSYSTHTTEPVEQSISRALVQYLLIVK